MGRVGAEAEAVLDEVIPSEDEVPVMDEKAPLENEALAKGEEGKEVEAFADLDEEVDVEGIALGEVRGRAALRGTEDMKR